MIRGWWSNGANLQYRFNCASKNTISWLEPWSSGYERRLKFKRLWVQIPAPYTGWTFFTLICCKNCNNVFLKRRKIIEKEAGVGPFKKNNFTNYNFQVFLQDWSLFCQFDLSDFCEKLFCKIIFKSWLAVSMKISAKVAYIINLWLLYLQQDFLTT